MGRRCWKRGKIENNRAPPQKSHPNDPAWLNRVGAIGLLEGREIEPQGFDQDLPGLEGVEDEAEDSDSSGTLKNCSDIDESAEQYQGIGADNTRDEGMASERSFEGSEAEQYYGSKVTREEGKRELTKLQRERRGFVEEANTTVLEVHATYTTSKSGHGNGKAEPLHSALEMDNTNSSTGFTCLLREFSPGMQEYPSPQIEKLQPLPRARNSSGEQNM